MKKIFSIIAICLLCSLGYSQHSMEIISQPQSISACAGSAATLSLTVEGNASDINYSVYFQSNSDPTFNIIYTATTTATTIEYTIANPNATNIGRYYFSISDGIVTINSNQCILTVSTAAPVINTINFSPNNFALCDQIRKDIILDVTPSEIMQYVWYKDGEHYTTISTNTLTFLSANANDAASYYVEITNGCGTATNINNPIELEFFSKPELLSFPNIPVACEGEDITITVNIAGNNNYTWLENGNPIIGATTNVLELENLQYPNTSTYQLIASNICFEDTVLTTGITTKNFPTIVSQPTSEAICLGETITLNALANSSSTVTYQWYGDGILLPSSNTTEYVINTADTYNNSYYYIAYNACGSDTSNVFNIEFISLPIFASQPHDTVVCVGDNVALNIKLTGDEPITSEWNFLHNNYGILMQDANTSTSNNGLIITNIQESQSHQYYCIATNVCGTAYSDTVTVTVNIPISLQMDIFDQELCEGEELTFSLAYTNQVLGTTPITYTWYKENVNGEDIILGNNNIYTNPSILNSDAGVYYCELTNTCNTIESAHATLTVKSLPHFTIQPQATSVCQGQTIYLNAEAEGETPISYLWYRNHSAISSQTSTNLVINNSQVNQTGYYYCLAQNECAAMGVMSDSVLVSVGTEVSFQNPLNTTPIAGANGLTFCEYETLELSTLVNGTNYNVTWYHNGNPILGENDAILTITFPEASYSGEYYCVVSNQCNEITSDAVQINITVAPTIDLGGDKDFCEGESVVLQTAGSYTNYNWTIDGNQQATHAPSLTVSESGVYTLQATDINSGCSNIDTITVTVHPYHNIALSENITACAEYFVLDAGAGAYQYTWSTGASYQTITVENSGEYSLTVTGDAFGCADSINITLNLNPPINVSLGDDIEVDINTGTSLNAGAGFETYEWFFGSENLNWQYPSLYVDGETYGEGTWEFSVTIGNGVCFASDTILVTFTNYNSVEEIQNTNISIYPNPANDIVYINSPEIIKNISIFTIDGKEVLRKDDNNYSELNINTLVAGSYFIKITNSDNTVIIRKFIKE